MSSLMNMVQINMNVTLKDMVDLVNSREEVRVRTENVDGQDFLIFCYMVASPDLWAEPFAEEARGITFEPNGRILSRTMKKFFNINELKKTQLQSLDFTDAVAYDKVDGSMITPVLVNGKVRVKTKKSFYSDVAIAAQAFIELPENKNIYDFMKHCLLNSFTPTMEFYSPNHQVVINYGDKEQMTLLMLLKNETGEEVAYSELEKLAEWFGIPLVKSYKVDSINEYLELAKTVEDIEGWVFHLPAMNMRVKLKTDWYLRRHRLTSYHERDIFDLIISEEIDDLIPLLELKDGAMDKVNEIAHQIAHHFKEVETKANDLRMQWTDMQMAEIGKKFNEHPYFSLAIRLHRGQEPDYKKFVVNNYRSNYTTKPIFWGFAE